MKVAFLGLGVMGYPMAGHLAAKGHDVTVYNRNADKAKAWVDQHGGGKCRAVRPQARPRARSSFLPVSATTPACATIITGD